jgi:hypothetical protein
MTKTTLEEINFTFKPHQEYDDNVYRLLVALPPGTYIEVAGLTRDKEKLLRSVRETCALMEIHDIEISHHPAPAIRKMKT